MMAERVARTERPQEQPHDDDGGEAEDGGGQHGGGDCEGVRQPGGKKWGHEVMCSPGRSGTH